MIALQIKGLSLSQGSLLLLLLLLSRFSRV